MNVVDQNNLCSSAIKKYQPTHSNREKIIRNPTLVAVPTSGPLLLLIQAEGLCWPWPLEFGYLTRNV